MNFLFAEASVIKPQADIRWIKNPSPPFHILEGRYSGLGLCDVLVDKLNEKLVPLSTTIDIYPQSRIERLIESSENLCFPCMIKRQDSDRFVYSRKTTVYPPLGVILSKALLSEVYPDQPQAISLKAMLNNQSLIFGVAEARRFPDILQTIIDQHEGASNVLALPGVFAPLRLLQQIELGRIHYTLDYPGVLRYFSIKENNQSLRYLPTTEFGAQSVYGAIGCTNNDWGKRAVDAIDAVLDDVMDDPEYRANQQFWLNTLPENP
ncbi:hypothetical protein [Alteromonas gilva]|uniref:ATP-grasp domain-containing protein n=1 Tax=Alteromonas gilva TaxID=2987522 RepID=A0ABT5L502_9ALTE|nr:hypothetical protein [Alteromonas gilva]MDC8831566.1 hypothetical protein [Alteromonas gilva]